MPFLSHTDPCSHPLSTLLCPQVSSYIQEAKRLSPLNESVIMLDADLLSINGETDAALAR